MRKAVPILLFMLIFIMCFVLCAVGLNAQSNLRHRQNIRDFYVSSHFVKLNLTSALAKNINVLYELGFANRLSFEVGGSYMIPTKFPNPYLNKEINIELDNKALKTLETSDYSGYSGIAGLNIYLDRSAGFDNEGWYMGIFGKYMRYNMAVKTEDLDRRTRNNRAAINVWMPGFHAGYKHVWDSGIFTDFYVGVGQGIGHVNYTIEARNEGLIAPFNRPLPRVGLRLGYKFGGY
jgi:hypothetical protein